MSDERLRVGSAFTGIGGFDLGLVRAGMRVVWQAEIEPYRQLVLAQNFPGVPNLGDVRSIAPTRIEPVEVFAFGFPCTDLSFAGRGAGIVGRHSGLWRECARLIRALRPRWVLVENVPAIRSRGLDVVLGDLASCGYDAEWDCIPATAIGAPHRRDRIWLVAYPAVADAEGSSGGSGPGASEAPRLRWGRLVYGGRRRSREWWSAEPGVGRVADGVPRRLDRISALGDSLVPQIAEAIGREIMDYERRTS